MDSQDIAAIAASVAATAAILGLIVKLRENRLKTRAMRFEEAGAWIIYVKPSRVLEECRVFLADIQLRTREKYPVDTVDVDIGGKNFDIPSSLEPKGKFVEVFSGKKRVYRKLFEEIRIKGR